MTSSGPMISQDTTFEDSHHTLRKCENGNLSLQRILLLLTKRRTELLQLNDEVSCIGSPLEAIQGTAHSIAVTRRQKELLEIQQAIQKVHAGIYGQCELCEEAIPLARLQKIPYAHYCVQCQTVSEREGRK